MIKLHGFGRCFGVVDASAFVVKVDLFMRIAKLPFETIVASNNLGKSPKGKLPFIDDDGHAVADSAFIFDYLMDKYQVDIDSNLSDEQKAQAYLLGKSLDENFYWYVVYSRWSFEPTWQIAKEAFFGKFPALLKLFLPNLIRRKVIKNLYGQGTGRHSLNEILNITDKSLSALSMLLSEQDYFFGEQPTSFDAIAYAHLCQFISSNYDNEFNQLAKKYDNLVAYCQRIENRYYL